MNPDGIDRGVGGLLAAAERASRRAPRLLSHALVDLTLEDGDRISEEVRVSWRMLLENAVLEVERGLRKEIAKDIGLAGATPKLHQALTVPSSLVLEVLYRTEFPDNPDLSVALLEQASNIVLRRKLSRRARRTGEEDPVRRLSAESTDRGSWATALLLSQSISEGPDAAAILAAELQHGLVWAVAAALRVALSPYADDADSLDPIMSAAATKLLAEHQEGRSVSVIALRLARLVDGQLSPATALISGYPELCAALLAEATDIDHLSIAAIQHESDCARLALLLKAAGVQRDDAARLFVALCEVRDANVESSELIKGYDQLDAVDARRALSGLRRDPAYARAISLYSGIEW